MDLLIYPAYGRMYENGEQAKADWEDGKDFSLGAMGPYCSKRDIPHFKQKGYEKLIVGTVSGRFLMSVDLIEGTSDGGT